MSKLFYLAASPRRQLSTSCEVAATFIETFKKVDRKNEVIIKDLWQLSLPELTDDLLRAKYKVLHNLEHSSLEAALWQNVVDITKEFMDADHYLFSIPMWNFSIPYKLKHFMDIVTQPGLTFSYLENGEYQGNLRCRSVTAIYSRGAEYGTEGEMDMQKAYMELFFRFIGMRNIHSILVEPTQTSQERKIAAIFKAKTEAIDLASQLF